MHQEAFEKQHAQVWHTLAQLLERLDTPRRKRGQDLDLTQMPGLYRRVCNHYAIARSRRYSPALVTELHGLILRAHRHLYRRRGAWLWQVLNFLGGGFPRALRDHRGYLGLALALFLLPGLLLGLGCYQDPDLIYSVLEPDQVTAMEAMYDPANRSPGRPQGRDSETDFVMFGFYIWNNVAIGFRTFASGVLLGLGTVAALLFNGVVLGAVAGHLSRLGYNDTFWTFVSGHGAFELTAIVICGAAGLRLGHAVLAPGQRRRIDALRRAALAALPLVLGAALMLLIAAFIEAFWSSSAANPTVKYSVAGFLWLAVILYLSRVGRHGSE